MFNGTYSLPDPFNTTKRPLLVYPANNYANAAEKAQTESSGVRITICKWLEPRLLFVFLHLAEGTALIAECVIEQSLTLTCPIARDHKSGSSLRDCCCVTHSCSCQPQLSCRPQERTAPTPSRACMHLHRSTAPCMVQHNGITQLVTGSGVLVAGCYSTCALL